MDYVVIGLLVLVIILLIIVLVKNNGSKENTEAVLLFPDGMSSVSKPYFEAGVGVENIFRIFRVDAIWRLSHRKEKPGQDIQNFAVNVSVYLNF